ncbi:MAG: transcriptional regulator, partial [Polyangiaceae bacterium]
VHEHTIARSFEQYAVPVKGQADIMVCGIPYISPYNVNSFLNPLLVQVLAEGYLFNCYRGKPLVKKGGTLIITHPCTDYFDKEHHASYIEFVHNLLPETRDALELHKRYEAKFASNPAYIQMYRTGHAYHPAHPFFMWYWGEAGRQHLGRVIVVGADNEYIPKLLGYETAKNMNVALEMAKDTAPPSPEITLFHTPPILMADVS